MIGWRMRDCKERGEAYFLAFCIVIIALGMRLEAFVGQFVHGLRFFASRN